MRAALEPEAASTFENRDDPSRIISAITVTRPAPHSDFPIATAKSGPKARAALKSPRASGAAKRYPTASAITPTHPKAAASDGVATPPMMRAMTKTMMETIGRTSSANTTMRRLAGTVSGS